MSSDLEQFVHDALARGLSRDAIRKVLGDAGWRQEEVESALETWSDADFPIPVPRRKPYLSAREAFLYLVLFASLYASAFNVGAVLFELIDRWLPTEAVMRYRDRMIRDATATLVIAFPVFLWVSSFVERAIARAPEKRGLEGTQVAHLPHPVRRRPGADGWPGLRRPRASPCCWSGSSSRGHRGARGSGSSTPSA